MPRTDDAGLIEKHVEKIVLAATAVGLIVVLAVWVVSSPRKLSLKSAGFTRSGGAYSPAGVDGALRKMADELEQRLEDERPPYVRVDDHTGRHLGWFGEPYPAARMPGVISLGSGRPSLTPTTQPKRARAELAKLLPVPAPAKPLAEAQRELVVIRKPAPVDEKAPAGPLAGARPAAEQTIEEETELVAAHVAAVFEFGKMLKKWRESLAGTRVRERLVVLAVEARRRHLLPEGRWSDPVPVSMVRVPTQAPFRPLPPFDPKTKNHPEVLAAVEGIADTRSQEWILEPEYYRVFRDRREIAWTRNKPRTRVSDLEGVAAAEGRPIAGRPAGGRPLQPIRPGQPATGEPLDPRTPTDYRRYMEERMRQYQPQQYRREEPRRERYYPPAPRSSTGRPRTVTPPRTIEPPRSRGRVPRRTSSRTPTPPRTSGRTRVVRPPDPRTYDPRLRRSQPGRPGPAPTSPLAEPEPQEPDSRVPALAEQLSHPDGILEVWFHDVTLTEMVAYSYQVRLVLLNPLFGQVKEVKNDKDADRLQLMTPWSQWSEPVRVKRPTEFFLTGAMPGRSVYVKVVTQMRGQTLDKMFAVRPGDPIGKKEEEVIPDLRGEEQKVTVDYETGAVVVDIGQRRVRIPHSSIDRSTTELLYLDADGKLRSRTLFEDERKLRKLRPPSFAPVVPRP